MTLSGGIMMPEEIKRHCLEVDVRLESPFAGRGLWADAPGVDTPLVRDHLGRLIIPASQLKGVLRHVLEEMAEQDTDRLGRDDIHRWFGLGSGDAFDPESLDADHFSPAGGRAVFGDLVCQQTEPSQDAVLIRVAINPDLGSVKEGALQVVEQPFPLGQEVPFKGRIVLFDGDAEADRFLEAVRLALGFLPALGGMKSSGFGRVAGEPDVTRVSSTPLVVTKNAEAQRADRQVFDLVFDEPFLVDAELLGQNMFQGSHIIPGGVIKGSLARMMELGGMMDADMETALSRVLFSHAFPLRRDQDRRPRAIPHTILSTGKKLYDCTNKQTIGKWKNNVVTWFPDWKASEWATARELFGWPKPPPHHVRTRTAIDSGTHAAREAQLFSYRLINPLGYKWRFVLDRGEADPGCYARIVSLLRGGLSFVGKSSAQAACQPAEDPQVGEAKAEPRSDAGGGLLWRVTLQTPAALFSARKCRRDENGRPPDLARIYQDYWRDVFQWHGHENLEFSSFSFWASQKWDGGYRARRYPEEPGRYLPYVLTQPGSVFIMSLDERSISREDQQKVFDHLARRGLPLFNAGTKNAPGLWRTCPYPPENGYGEVCVDWGDHEKLRKGVKVAREGVRQ